MLRRAHARMGAPVFIVSPHNHDLLFIFIVCYLHAPRHSSPGSPAAGSTVHGSLAAPRPHRFAACGRRARRRSTVAACCCVHPKAPPRGLIVTAAAAVFLPSPSSSSSPSSRIFLLAPGLFRGRATRAVSGGGGGRWQARSFPRSHSASSCRPALSSRVDPSCRGAAPRRQNNNWHLRRTCPKHDGNHTPRAFRSVGPNRGRCRDCHRRARGQSFEPGWLIERWLAQAAAWSSPTSPHQKKDLSALKKQSSK